MDFWTDFLILWRALSEYLREHSESSKFISDDLKRRAEHSSDASKVLTFEASEVNSGMRNRTVVSAILRILVRNTADPIAERIEHNTAHLTRMADIGANLFCFAKRKLKIAILQIRPNNYARVTIVLFVAAIPGSGG